MPGPVRDFRKTAVTSTSITVAWTRPKVTIGPGFHYAYQIFDPDGFISDRLILLPFTASSESITFIINGLRPVTAYVIRITTHNEISDLDVENEALRRVDLQVKTSEGGK